MNEREIEAKTGSGWAEIVYSMVNLITKNRMTDKNIISSKKASN